ncbi:MAG TPA: DUF1501 domain-containing protein [Woeseiaceae bacterium]|nr:DUF1501 domain-containing protein [Woeseiaceae bacterium]
MTNIRRRNFLKASGAAAAFAACPGAAFSQGIGGSAPFDDYKALVCVFLFGGNDSFNMVVPRSNAEYNVYAASRQNLSIPQGDLLPINPLTPDGAQYGFHPSMAGLHGLFESNRVAIVSNVGPLIQPTTRDQFFQQSVPLPPQLFSHNDQQDQWHSLKGNTQSSTGWAGRMADLIRTNVSAQQMATNASLSGNNLFQSAHETIAYVMGPGGPIPFEAFSNSGDPNDILYQQRLAFERIINASYSSIYERGFAEIQRRAVAAADRVGEAIAGAPVLNTVFPATQLGQQLQTVARLIAVRGELQMQRQVFFVAAGGFDSHDNQNQDQPGLLGGVSEAMTAFYAATAELGVADAVTSFTQSDFARTLTSNGDGTDHAWGGIQLVVGDAVRGRDLYGIYPPLAIDGPDDVGGGRMIPTTSADQYAATLARWFGIPDAELDIVAPHIDNFAVRDLGFFV